MKWLSLVAALTLLVGCQQAPAAKRAAARPDMPSLAELRSEAAALAARADHEGAAAKYRLAVERDPDDVGLRYLFGVSLSHLEGRPETTEQFRFVVTRGRPDSEEVEIARRWLAQHATDGPTRSGMAVSEPSSAAAAAATPTDAKVKGKTDWAGIDTSTRRTVRIELGRDGEPRGPRTRMRHFVFGQPYEFTSVLPGRYRLTAMVEGVPLWDQTITVEAGKDVVLDLTTANSSAPAGAAKAFGPQDRTAASR